MTETPVCVDCVFYSESYNPSLGSHACRISMVEQRDIVTGKRYETGLANCYAMRSEGGPCGPQGLLFKRKDE